MRLHLHTFEDRKAEALQERGWWSRTRSDSDRGRFRSKHRTTVPPRSTHMQPGDVSNTLIQQGGRRGWGRAPAAARRRGGGGACGDPAELRYALRRRRRRCREGRAAPDQGVLLPSLLPSIYMLVGEGSGPPRSHLGVEAAAKGGRSASQVKWRPSPLRVFFPHAHGPEGGWCPWPIKARAPPYSPCFCIGRGGTISGPPDPSGILRNLPEASRYNTGKNRTFSGTPITTSHI